MHNVATDDVECHRISTIESELQGVYKASTYNEQVTEMHEAWKVGGNKRVGSSIKFLTECR